MFEKYSNKQKFLGLLAVALLLAITAYKRSYSQLVQLYHENTRLEQRSQEIKSTKNDVESLRQALYQYDQIIGKQGIGKEVVQQHIVGFTAARPSVHIAGLSPVHSLSRENFIVNTNVLDVSGDLDDLLGLGYGFEKDFSDSRLSSLHFYKAKENNNREILHLKLYFQNYEKAN